MFDTPCVSTPRRSVIVSTSAASARRRAHAELLEDLGDRPSQRRFRDEDLVLLGYLEALEDHGRLLPALEDTPRTGVMEALAMS